MMVILFLDPFTFTKSSWEKLFNLLSISVKAFWKNSKQGILEKVQLPGISDNPRICFPHLSSLRKKKMSSVLDWQNFNVISYYKLFFNFLEMILAIYIYDTEGPNLHNLANHERERERWKQIELSFCLISFWLEADIATSSFHIIRLKSMK